MQTHPNQSPRHLTRLMLVSFMVAGGARFAAAQPKYTVHDLGTLGSTFNRAFGINNAGQVVGLSGDRAFRTAPNSAINAATDDVGTLFSGGSTVALGINDLGQVVGSSSTSSSSMTHAFRTAPNSAINPSTDDLGTLFASAFTVATGINDSGQVVGYSTLPRVATHAFRTAPNSAINPATDDIGALTAGPLLGSFIQAFGINHSGQVTGVSFTHAFRTAANGAINAATDDLGAFSGGCCSTATGINASGQVIGFSSVGVSGNTHAFRTAPNGAINTFTDDLGTLGGTFSTAQGINSSGQVVGWSDLASPFEPPHAFLYSGGVLYDLNNLIPLNSGLILTAAYGINDLGQIVGEAIPSGSSGSHVFRLDPPPTSVVSVMLDSVGSFDLPPGISNALTSSLQQCLNAMHRGDMTAARNQLGAFRTKVNALRGKKLTDTQANMLLGFAATAIRMIS